MLTRLRHAGRVLLSGVFPDPLLLANYSAARRRIDELHSALKSEPVVLTGSVGVGIAGIRRWRSWTEDHVMVPPAVEPADVLRGWRGGMPDAIRIPALRDLVHVEHHGRARFEIQAVEGLASSKSDLRAFACLDDMADQQCQELMRSHGDDHSHLTRLMAHQESRVFHGGTDELVRYGWDGRIMLSNSGGSHHFVAARRLAGRMDQQVWCEAPVRTENLVPAAVAALRKHYHIVAVPIRLENAIHDVAMLTGAAYYKRPMPRPDVRQEALFLPRDIPSSVHLAEQLLAAGAPNVVHIMEQGLTLQADLQPINSPDEPPRSAPQP